MNNRYEIKIPLNNKHFLNYKNWLITLKGLFQTYDDRWVENIYYDNFQLSCALDNLAGIANRSKFRLRWYVKNKSQSNCFIEIKKREGRIGTKEVISTNKQVDLIDIKNVFSVTSPYLAKHFQNKKIPNTIIAQKILPTLQVKYERSYFLYENLVRVTFDKPPIFKSLINEESEKKDWFADSLSVLEIKFDPKNLDLAKKLIHAMPFVPKRHSKYLRGLYCCNEAVYF
tara:strand:+ start:40 stop:723 length:684 start_codon:yes stop_codon:yes gene_type:complete